MMESCKIVIIRHNNNFTIFSMWSTIYEPAYFLNHYFTNTLSSEEDYGNYSKSNDNVPKFTLIFCNFLIISTEYVIAHFEFFKTS